ncbi:MAG: peptidoglycan-binding protein [Hyphomicrobiaceae bacterium]|nr:peptidoglycan-binding protein [Hyphomicrobiaceae bacterium]
MTSLFRALCLSVATLAASAFAAQALECKSKAVTVTSDVFLSKSFGAYPASWAMWRKKVKEEVGNGWQAWRRARDQKIECDRVPNGRGGQGWQCKRTGVPCRNGPEKPDACGQYPTISAVLKRGASGDQVKMLQCRLIEHGVKIEIDGDYGRATEKAVREFQTKNGLKVDGVVGDLTAEKLMG